MTAVFCIKITNRQSIQLSTVGFVLVRVVGLEPTRQLAEEPKGYVTLVKDFQSHPYRKGRTSFQRFKRNFGRDRPNTC